MSTDIMAGGFGELRSASTAAGGTALTTTPQCIQLPRGTRHVFMTPRNFATAVVAQVTLNPWLTVLKTTDIGVTFTDYSYNAQDGDAGTDVTLSSLDTVANGDWLLVGSQVPFRGLLADVDSTNAGGATVMAVHYHNSAMAWTDITPTDGTTAGGKSVAQDGAITWTVPAGWTPFAFETVYPSGSVSSPVDTIRGKKLYWVRISFDVALDASCTLNSLLALNRSTAYAELVAGQLVEERVKVGFGGVGCIEARTDAGTANLIVNVAAERDGIFG